MYLRSDHFSSTQSDFQNPKDKTIAQNNVFVFHFA